MDRDVARWPGSHDWRLTRRDLLRLTGGLAGLAAAQSLLAACGGSDEATATSAASGGGASPGASPAVGAASPTAGAAQGGGRLTIIVAETVNDLDPQSVYTATNNAVMFGMYEMLARLKGDSTFDYEPMLAKSWTHNDDFSEWTFTLNEGVTFHDGTPCDANAVVAAYRRLYDLSLAPKNVIYRYVDKPEDITAPDATTVTFKLKQGNDIFIAAVSSDYGNYIPSPAAVEAHKTADDPYAHEWFLQNGVGTGPYKMKEFVENDHITLERFDGYRLGWDGPHFDEIVYRLVLENATRRSLIEAGEGDVLQWSLTPSDLQALQQAGKLNVQISDSMDVKWTAMNGVTIADPKARQGFSYAFPYDDVRTGVWEGLIQKTSGPMAPTMRGYDQNGFIYTQDLDKAKQLLTDAGWDFGQKLEYWIDGASETDKAIAQLYQSSLQQLDIQMDIVAKEGGALITFFYGDTPGEQRPHFWSWEWWPDYNDGWTQIYTNFYSMSNANSAGTNPEFYKDDQVDKDLDTVAPGVPVDQYNQLMADCNNVLTGQDPGAIFWGAAKWFTIMQPNIQGFQPNPVYLFVYNLYDMYRA